MMMAGRRPFAAIARERVRRENDRTARLVTDVRFEAIRARRLVAFRCECADPACRDFVSLTLDEYADVRAHRGWYVLSPGHAERDPSSVVRTTDRFGIVTSQPPHTHIPGRPRARRGLG